MCIRANSKRTRKRKSRCMPPQISDSKNRCFVSRKKHANAHETLCININGNGERMKTTVWHERLIIVPKYIQDAFV